MSSVMSTTYVYVSSAGRLYHAHGGKFHWVSDPHSHANVAAPTWTTKQGAAFTPSAANVTDYNAQLGNKLSAVKWLQANPISIKAIAKYGWQLWQDPFAGYGLMARQYAQPSFAQLANAAALQASRVTVVMPPMAISKGKRALAA